MHINDLYAFGHFHLDVKKRRLVRDGQAITLTPKVLDTLVVLVENSGQVVDKDDLLKAVWPDTNVEEGNLAQNISVLRKILGETAERHEYIETVPKKGYRFVAQVREVVDRKPRYRLRFALILAAVALSCVIVFVFWRVPGTPRRAQGIRSMAVLPFVNVSSEPGNDYFSDGLTDELIFALSKVEGLRVPPRSSAFQFKGKPQDVRTVGKLLKVGAVLEGSVRKEKDNLRITAQLSDATDGYQLWSETYQGDAKDVFAIQEKIARGIVSTLRIRLRGQDQTALIKRESNLRAYELTLKGRQWAYREPTLETLAEGVRYFREASVASPDYAAAYSGLSYIHMKSICYDVAPKDSCPKAKEAAERALQLDSSLTEPRVTLANVQLWCEWNFAGAEREFRTILEIDPNKADAYLWYALLLGSQGRSDDALASIRRAIELNPLDYGTNVRLSWVYYHARDYHRALEAARSAVQLNPQHGAHGLMAGAYGVLGRYQEAIAEVDEDLKKRPNHPVLVARRAYYLAAWGKRAEAMKGLQRLKELSKVRYVPAARYAEIYAALNDKEQAFYWLEKAYQEHSPTMFHLKVSPEYDNLRSDPRFDQLLKRVYG